MESAFRPLHEQLLLNLVDWPLVFVAALVVAVVYFRGELRQLIARGGFTLTWGDKSFSVSELPNELDESLAPIADDIERLKRDLATLQQQLQSEPREVRAAALTPAETETLVTQLRDALSNPRFRWRSLEALAATTGTREEETVRLLREHLDVEFGADRSKRRIVRLAGR